MAQIGAAHERPQRNNHESSTNNTAWRLAGTLLGLASSLSPALAQVAASPAFPARVPANQTAAETRSAPPTLTLFDALETAQRIEPQFQSALSNLRLAHQDRLQSRAAPLPTLSGASQYINTQGNGLIPTGRFVTSDGVHVYREWGILRQDLSPAVLARTDHRRAAATEVISQSKAEKARLALAVTVTKAYNGLAVVQRKYATAQQGLDRANRLVALGQGLERSGRKPQNDVTRVQLQHTAEEKSFREVKHPMENARLALAVLLFRDFDENFGIVDDLRVAPRSIHSLRSCQSRSQGSGSAGRDRYRVAGLNVSMARRPSCHR